MKILVTGGAGFIASHVAEASLKLGHQVVILDNLSRGRQANVPQAARFHLVDVCDRRALDDLFAAERPDIVNHHAAQMDVRRGVREPVYDAQVNILGSLNLLEAAVAHRVRRFLYVSTAGAAYGEPTRIPVAEEAAVNPVTPYGISKHTVEHYLFTFHFLYGLPYVVLRYGNVYGPRQSSAGEAGVFAIFCEQMLAGVQPVIYGDGGKVRDYVYIDDVARANVAALNRGDQQIFNIASGRGTTDYQVFCLVRRLLSKEGLEPRFTAKRRGEIDRICLDISKAEKMLRWTPEIGLGEGAARTVRYFENEHQRSAPVDTSSAHAGRKLA